MLLYPRLFYSYFVSQIHYFSNFLGNFKMKPPFLIFAPGWHKIMDSIEVNRVDFNAVLDMVKSQPESALSGTSLSLIERCHVQRLALTLRCATNFVQFYYWVSWICNISWTRVALSLRSQETLWAHFQKMALFLYYLHFCTKLCMQD